MRRHVVKYDDVMNKHREIIYTRRQGILDKLEETEGTEGTDETTLHEDVVEALKKEVENLVLSHAAESDPEKWDIKEIGESMAALHPVFASDTSVEKLKEFQTVEDLQANLTTLVTDFYSEKCGKTDDIVVAQAERVIVLRAIDFHWMDHIDDMAHLREQVAFAGYAQRDPLIEYQDQGFRRFQQLLATIDSTIARTVLQEDFAQFQPRQILQQAQESLDVLQTNEDAIEAEFRETGVARRLREPNRVIRW